MHGNSRAISSAQTDTHEQLPALVERYLSSPFQRPFSKHTIEAFERANDFIKSHKRPVILDACCGTALSTQNISHEFPEHTVIGIDKSLPRINKIKSLPDNALVLQADLLDFYRLAEQHNWQLERHYLLYPNPWPKISHIKRRWHAMPCFPSMLSLGGMLEVRSNWDIYIREFSLALDIAGFESQIDSLVIEEPITAFERKYRDSQHTLWRCRSDLNSRKTS